MTWQDDQHWRAQARSSAEAVLRAQSFKLTGTTWRGNLAGFACDVELAESFPFTLPKIILDRTQHSELIAHVDSKGSVCFADTTNILIDAHNPEELIRQALEMAAKILAQGEAKTETIAEEFTAYWAATGKLWNLCTIDGNARSIVIAKRNDPTPWYIAADNIESLTQWLQNRSLSSSNASFHGYLVPFITAPVSLLQPKHLLFRHVCLAIRNLVVPEARERVFDLLRAGNLPTILIATFPIGGTNQHGAAAMILRKPPRVPGFRPGKLRALEILRVAGNEMVDKVDVVRSDPAYLLPRGGADTGMRQTNAIVVGAGAIGGWICQLLASAGVGRLGIVDSDIFSADNLHRHILGMNAVGQSKAAALVERLKEQFPHQEFWFRFDDCVKVLSDSSFNLDEVNFIILATGNETLELRLSAALRKKVTLAHVWLDPFDLGHHVFVDGKDRPGCLRCLFERDDLSGLYNRASFLKRGQVVTRSLAGCAGNYAPYSVQHALSAASGLVELVARGDLVNGPFLQSKFCSTDTAIQLGFAPSARSAQFSKDEIQRTVDFGSAACESCSR